VICHFKSLNKDMEPCKVLKYYPCFIKALEDSILHKREAWEEESR
jgi:hypothetical protein